MNVLYFMIPATLLMAGIFLAMFWWALKGGQFDDFETAPLKAIQDDDENNNINSIQKTKKE